ncbi:MAG: four helix bundle protein [Chitinophagaceae bacterium]|nr:four helix bundle protein [Chitinophagaceae bacterium]
MATIRRFEDLEIWQRARELCKKVYSSVMKPPISKEYRLADQMKGSSGSVMDNIAEGFDRGSRLEFVNSLSIARGEAGELKSQLYRCLDNNFISQELFDELLQETDELIRKISSFIDYLNKSAIRGQKFKDRVK